MFGESLIKKKRASGAGWFGKSASRRARRRRARGRSMRRAMAGAGIRGAFRSALLVRRVIRQAARNAPFGTATARRAPWSTAGLMAGAAIASAAVTAGAFLLSGPAGRRRRGLMADRVRHVRHEASEELDRAARDLGHRARGAYARVRRADRAVDDALLVERSRAALGHVCSDPHAIQIEATDGVIVLRGDVLSEEREAIVRKLDKVSGVRRVVDELTAHARPDGEPSSQGGSPQREREADDPRARWSPAARLVAGAAGLGLVAFAAVRRRPLSLLGGAGGGLLMLRAMTNRELASWQGPFAVKKSVFIGAAPDDVFSLIAQPERLPLFMTHVKEVRKIDDEHYEWRLDGTLGEIRSVCEITRFAPVEDIAWKSVEDGVLRSRGNIHFVNQDGGTRLDVDVTYQPRAGTVGYALSRVLQRDPKKLLDDDLLRLKSLLEDGKATGNQGQVSLSDFA